MRFTLWQRIFVYTVLLLAVSQVLAFFLHNALYRQDIRRYFASSVKAVAAEIEGRPLGVALTHTKIYSHGQHRLWLTKPDGSSIPGEMLSKEFVLQAKVVDQWEELGVPFVAVDRDPRFWGKLPVQLEEGPYLLYLSFGPPPGPVRHAFLFQLFVPVLIVSIALALWIALSVSRPLRRLRDEVREMAETGPGNAVTVSGKDEIAEVAQAVNSMAGSLAKHVNGMRSLLANVSHELRSPLARANIALGIVEESLPPEYSQPPKAFVGEKDPRPSTQEQMAAKYLSALQEELAHMDTLIGTTLLTQKIALEQESVPMDAVDFSALCVTIWKRYKIMFERNALAPVGDIAQGLTVSGNRTLLQQMLTNLLDNCLKYTSRGGEVRFTLGARGGNCTLCVENSYETVDEAKLDHIFDPFYRVDQATGTGVGLGLALVQKTVELHGGEIMAVPTEMGLCVCAQLPLADND